MKNILLHKETTTLIRLIIVAIILGILSVSCIRDKPVVVIPTPAVLCRTNLDWNGVTPGISTRQEVLDRLGTPIDRGRKEFSDGQRIQYYSYPVSGGTILEYIRHRVYFRPDGIVDWIEEIVADRDGEFQTVQEAVDKFGNELDIVYPNNDYNPYVEFQYDIHGGPDQVLVWSECGIAVLAIWEEWDIISQNGPNAQILSIRHPDFYDFTDIIPNLTGNIMMNFLFQPTTFDGFVKHYMYRIPYGLWDDYLEKNAH
jgi:hypothetical protein